MDFTKLLIKFVIFIVLMLVGYFYSRKKLISPEFARSASKLTLEVFMSATILNSVIINPPTMSGRDLLWTLFVISAAMLLMYVVAAVVIRVLPGEKSDPAALELLMGVPNSIFIGLPVLQQVLGDGVVFYAALSNIPFNILLYTYGVWRLKGGGKETKMRLKDFMSVPLIATLVSLLIFALKLDMPLVVRDLVGTMAGATMPLSMLVIGASLGSVKLTDAVRSKHTYLVSIVKLVVVPLVVWFVMGLFVKDAYLMTVVTVIAGCPSGIMVSVLAMQYGHDGVYSSKAILVGTALSMLTIPVLVYLIV